MNIQAKCDNYFLVCVLKLKKNITFAFGIKK
jgi:hypothetical protein